MPLINSLHHGQLNRLIFQLGKKGCESAFELGKQYYSKNENHYLTRKNIKCGNCKIKFIYNNYNTCNTLKNKNHDLISSSCSQISVLVVILYVSSAYSHQISPSLYQDKFRLIEDKSRESRVGAFLLCDYQLEARCHAPHTRNHVLLPMMLRHRYQPQCQ